MIPYSKRRPDSQYKDLLCEILELGVVARTRQGMDAITRIAPRAMRFNLDNGFPLITERNMAPKAMSIPIWQVAIGEICAFVNGARTTTELKEFGCHWWQDFATKEKCEKRGLEPGDLGPGSYGSAFHDFPTREGSSFNQFAHLVEQIRELPDLRTHFVSPWIPQYVVRGEGKTQKVVVAPCHGWLYVRIINGQMTVEMHQRSGDLPVGVPSNTAQYAALAMMLSQVTGFPLSEFIHSFSDAHIYLDQIPAVEKMLSRESRAFPTVEMDSSVNELFTFRREHFSLSDYHPHPGIKSIPVAI